MSVERFRTAVMSAALWFLAAAGVVGSCQIATAQDLLLDASVYGDVNLPLTQSTANLESLIVSNPNFDPLGQINPSDRLRILGRPVGRLDILFEHGTAVCTAFVISEQHILTNSHCIPGPPVAGRLVEATLLMGYHSELDVSSVQRFAVNTVPVETSAVADLDYSILEVDGNPAETWGTVRLAARDPEPAATLLVIHHPAGRPKMVTRGGCIAASPNPVQGSTLFHRCDTMVGSSGSPVFLDATGEVVGLHHAGISNRTANEFNKAKLISQIAAISPTIAASIDRQVAESRPGAGHSVGEENEASLAAPNVSPLQHGFEFVRPCKNRDGETSDCIYRVVEVDGNQVRMVRTGSRSFRFDGILEGNTLEGFWVVAAPGECATEHEGTNNFGSIKFTFDATFSAFDEAFSRCEDGAPVFLQGVRRDAGGAVEVALTSESAPPALATQGLTVGDRLARLCLKAEGCVYEVTSVDGASVSMVRTDVQGFRFEGILTDGLLEGFWFVDNPARPGSCNAARQGTKSFGRLRFEFDDTFTTFRETLGRCLSGPETAHQGHRNG